MQIGVFGGFDMGRVWVKNESSKTWHNDFGGGFWLNILDTFSSQIGMFISDESSRFSFGLGFSI